jgi:hypothetical protein
MSGSGEVEAITSRCASSAACRPIAGSGSCTSVTAAATEYVAPPIRHHGYTSAIARYAKLDRNRTLLERAVAAAPPTGACQRLAWTLPCSATRTRRRTRRGGAPPHAPTMTGLLAIDTPRARAWRP